MSANFYLSSHANNHLHPRAAVVAARQEDYKHATEQELAFIEIWSASAMQKMCKRLNLRQQVLATAIVFFRRFYLRNSYCETEPSLVAAACVYVAAKAEETPVHVKSAVSEAKAVFNEMGMTTFQADNNRLAEMEFYLIEELDFHLIVFHPYRALMQLCGRDGGEQAGGEEGRESRRKMLEMDDHSFQMAWFIINDTFRSSLCLIHPPHLIALASIYLALAMNPPRSLISAFSSLNNNDHNKSSHSTTSTSSSSLGDAGVASRTRRRGSGDASNNPSNSNLASSSSSTAGGGGASNAKPGGQTDPLTFLASLDIDQTSLLEIIQEIISLYELWSMLESTSNSSQSTTTSPASPNPNGTTIGNPSGRGLKLEGNNVDQKLVGLIKRMQESRMRELREERSRAAQVGGSSSSTAGSGKRG
ncbi:cyclin-dependent protein serine/threonine kinase regulator SSN8 [Sporobolomyces salmoneus]|uniref:cyclin-dependent protein serine/threonine kinase regulator SSN8 n=1 Tax=Sporobolomyces salmoneus TaxID=183962 RepID=UPI00316C2E8F